MTKKCKNVYIQEQVALSEQKIKKLKGMGVFNCKSTGST